MALKPATRRHAFTLDLRGDPALIREYRRLHTPEGIWPEIPRGIREVGILDMEIHLEGTRLVMLIEAPADLDLEAALARLATLPRQGEWEAFVDAFQAPLPGTPKWRPMERIFQLPPAVPER